MSGGELLLLVEDDSEMRASCRQALEEAGYRVRDAASPREAEPILAREAVDLVVTDLRMPEGGARAVQQAVRDNAPGLPVILITAYPSVESAVEAFRAGAVDYLLKPFTRDQLLEAAAGALEARRARDRSELLRVAARPDPDFEGMIGRSPRFHGMLAEIRRAGPLDAPVLILGETGSGKELVARSVHRLSRRAAAPWVAVNCAAVPEPLLEAELFGYEKGAFTGAAAAKPGLLELAHGGSLLLDEVGDLPAGAQGKLLRALEERTCRRVGGLEGRPADVRVVAATHRDLVREMRTGGFREDLYYRLSALEIRVPPLRERPEDVPLLAVAFLERLKSRGDAGAAEAFSEEALDALGQRPWPGNVRQLQNVVQRACARARGPLLAAGDLAEPGTEAPGEPAHEDMSRHRDAVARFERTLVEETLDRSGGNVTHAAQALGIHRTTLQRLMRRLAILPR